MAYSYKCSISFGLVYIPVTLHASVKTQDGKTPMQIYPGREGNRIYSQRGLSITLASEVGGFGGKTGLPVFAHHANCLAWFFLCGLSVFADSRGNVKDVQIIQFQENKNTPSLSMPKNEGVAHLNF